MGQRSSRGERLRPLSSNSSARSHAAAKSLSAAASPASSYLKVVVPGLTAHEACFLPNEIFRVPGVASVGNKVVLRELTLELALLVG